MVYSYRHDHDNDNNDEQDFVHTCITNMTNSRPRRYDIVIRVLLQYSNSRISIAIVYNSDELTSEPKQMYFYLRNLYYNTTNTTILVEPIFLC